jgi:large subunit ribosomal protein L1
MAKLSKRQKAIREKLQPGKVYNVEEALAVLKEFASKKFSETVDVAINLGVDPRKSDQVVRGATTLPNGTGKTTRVAVFTQGPNAEKAKAAGADIVGMDDLAEEIKGGRMDFDVVIASPDAMRVVGTLGQVLGPRGLMPNPKTGTVTFDVGKAVREIKAGKVEFRVDKTGIVHAPCGKIQFDEKRLYENARALIEAVMRAKPPSSKGKYIRSISICSTMSPGIWVDQASVESPA